MGIQGGSFRSDRPDIGAIVVTVILFVSLASLFSINMVAENNQPKPIFHKVELIENGQVLKTWTARGFVNGFGGGIFAADQMGRFIDDETGQEVVVPLKSIVVTRTDKP